MSGILICLGGVGMRLSLRQGLLVSPNETLRVRDVPEETLLAYTFLPDRSLLLAVKLMSK